VDEIWFTCDTFAPLVGATFTARLAGDGEVPLVLVEANDSGVPGGAAPDGRSRTQFSLVFRGPAEVALDQGTYELSAAATGPQSIFIVPIRADAHSRYYEAVFA
jgi:hypothetical protein